MLEKAKYDSEAREVIDNICTIIIDKFNFKIDSSHSFMTDGVSKVLIKNELLIFFLWDFKEAQIVWNFKKLSDDSGYSIDYRNIYPENSFYHGLKSYRKYLHTEKPSKHWDRFVPKAIEKSFLDFLDKWINDFPELFEKGNYAAIEHLEQHGHQSAESMQIERELIDKMIREEKST